MEALPADPHTIPESQMDDSNQLNSLITTYLLTFLHRFKCLYSAISIEPSYNRSDPKQFDQPTPIPTWIAVDRQIKDGIIIFFSVYQCFNLPAQQLFVRVGPGPISGPGHFKMMDSM